MCAAERQETRRAREQQEQQELQEQQRRREQERREATRDHIPLAIPECPLPRPAPRRH